MQGPKYPQNTYYSCLFILPIWVFAIFILGIGLGNIASATISSGGP
jgi:hypothetical protein